MCVCIVHVSVPNSHSRLSVNVFLIHPSTSLQIPALTLPDHSHIAPNWQACLRALNPCDPAVLPRQSSWNSTFTILSCSETYTWDFFLPSYHIELNLLQCSSQALPLETNLSSLYAHHASALSKLISKRAWEHKHCCLCLLSRCLHVQNDFCPFLVLI